MKTKKLLLYLKLCAFSLIVIYGCRKISISKEDSLQFATDEIKQYLQKVKTESTQKDASTIDSISKELNFATVTKDFFLGKEIISIECLNSYSKTGGNALKKIIFYKKDNLIESASIVKISSQRNDMQFLSTKFYEITALKEKEFSGEIELFNLKNKLIAIYGYENSRLSFVKSLTPKSINNSNQRTNTSIDNELECTAWYLETTYFYSDGTQETTRVYLYTTCESNGGGGGGGGGSEGTIVNNPCNQVDSLKTDTAFIAKMKNLKDSTGALNEKGYSMTRNSNGTFTYSSLNGPNGTASIDITGITSAVSGILHSHYSGLLSIFSGSDLRSIYQLYNTNKIDNINNFTMGLVTNGTTYILKVTDLTAFQQFANTWLSDNISFNAFETLYSSLYGITPTNSSGTNEANFIKLLNTTNSGLKLFSGNNTNFDAWTLKSVDTNGNIITANCN